MSVQNLNKTKTEKIIGIEKILFVLLLIQNISFYLVMITGSHSLYVYGTLIMDICCYFILSMVFLLSKSNKLRISGLCFFIWVILTPIWRLNLNIYSTKTQTMDLNSAINIFNQTSFYYYWAGIIFAIGIFLLSWNNQHGKFNIFLVDIYGLGNLISVLFGPIGIISKLFFIPLLGIIAYLSLIKGLKNNYKNEF